MAKRIEYIDIAKGLGILLVVMGHNDFSLVSPFFYKFIYSFHMPLFFFLSGMFFKSELPLINLLRRRYSSLLKPYIVAVLLIFFMTVSFTKVDFGSAITKVVKAAYANGHYIDWVQLWFLPHLFVLNVFAYFFYKAANLFRSNLVKWIFLISILIIGVIFIGVFWPFTLPLLGRGYTLYGLPLSIDLVLVSGFFFILGCEVNRIVPEDVYSSPFTLFGSIVMLVAMVIFLSPIIDFNTRVFQSLPINTIEALLGILFILAISKQIERIPQLSRALSYVGQTSLIILIFHVPIQETLGAKILGITGNEAVSYWISYFAGVVFPILINYFVIQPNPIVRSWFGQSARTETLSNN